MVDTVLAEEPTGPVGVEDMAQPLAASAAPRRITILTFAPSIDDNNATPGSVPPSILRAPIRWGIFVFIFALDKQNVRQLENVAREVLACF